MLTAERRIEAVSGPLARAYQGRPETRATRVNFVPSVDEPLTIPRGGVVCLPDPRSGFGGPIVHRRRPRRFCGNDCSARLRQLLAGQRVEGEALPEHGCGCEQKSFRIGHLAMVE